MAKQFFLTCKTNVLKCLMARIKTRLKKPKYRNISFRPTEDVARILMEAEKQGRGTRSVLINAALERMLPQIIKRYEAWRAP